MSSGILGPPQTDIWPPCWLPLAAAARNALVHSVCLPAATFVHCAQTAEDIDTCSVAYDSPMAIPDRITFGFIWVNPH